MVYIVENNGVYGLTKGQFSATADRGSKSKRGVVNNDSADRPGGHGAAARRDLRGALASPATRRSSCRSSRRAIEHQGAAFIDVISPCVAFNNHAGSTKSFDYVREHNEAVNQLDFITGRDADHTSTTRPARCRWSSSTTARKLRAAQARRRLRRPRPARRDELSCGQHAAKGQIVTGLLYVDSEPEDLHRHLNTVDTPLNTLAEKELCPGSAALEKINGGAAVARAS